MLDGLPKSSLNLALPLISLLPIAGAIGLEKGGTPTLAERAVLVNTGPVIFTKPAPLDLRLQNNDKAILPAQICGIIGAYFLTIFVIGICLLTFGRRMRRQAQYGSGLLELEMVKSPQRQFEPSPISPASTTKSWMRFGRGRKSVGSTKSVASSTPGSPGFDPHNSFDAKVMQSDRENRQREMEMLYEAVMEHDAKKASPTRPDAIQVHEIQPPPMSPLSPDFPTSPLSPHPQQQEFAAPGQLPYIPKDKRILRVQTERDEDVPKAVRSPITPNSPGSINSPVRAIYPPDSPLPDGPRSPRSPVRAGSRTSEGRPPVPPLPQGLPASPRSPKSNRMSSTSSVASGQTSASGKARNKLRNLRISAANQRSEGDEDERQPLTPRTAGLPTPGTGKSFNSVTTAHTFITEEDDEEEALDQPQPLPRPAPHRAAGDPRFQPPQTLQLPGTSKSAASSASTLPLRNHNTVDTAIPPTPVKTTYLESRQRGHYLAGPRTAGLTPRTGVPATPYSPYMPFTPITPVTPHLVGRKERKAMQREGRRRVMARDDGDLVMSPKEIWEEEY